MTTESVILADQPAEISRTVTNTVSREAHWDVSSIVTQTVSYEIGCEAVGGEVGSSTALSFTTGVFVHYGQKKGGHYFWYVPLSHLYDRSTLDQRQRETLRVDYYAHACTTQRAPRPDERE